MFQDVARVLIDEARLAEKIRELGARISSDYAQKNLLMVSVLKGSVVFMSDLMRTVDIPMQVDFMSVTSYGSGVKTTGVVKILKDLDHPIAGYDLLIVEDILDSGMTLSYLTEILRSRGPKSMRLITLLDKPGRRQAQVEADYVGFTIPDEFVVGYGLDYNERYRNLPFVGVLDPSVYQDAAESE